MNRLVRVMSTARIQPDQRTPGRYTEKMACAICETRRPRRFCPGVRGDICAPCCGAEREVTVDCPFDCEYLIESRKHDRPPDTQGMELPNRDIRLTESFIEDNRGLLTMMAGALLDAALG